MILWSRGWTLIRAWAAPFACRSRVAPRDITLKFSWSSTVFLLFFLEEESNSDALAWRNYKAGIFDAGDAAVNECLKNKQKPDKNNIFISQHDFDVYKIHFGSLSVYRFTLKCKCNNLSSSQRCSRFLPFSQQGWGGYMGTLTNSYFVPRKRP